MTLPLLPGVVLDDRKPLPPMFSFYGAKHRSSSLYPSPRFPSIVEPFAGSAAYSSRYHWLNVRLFDLDEVICGVWDYLVKAKPSEVQGLPLLEPGQTTDSLSGVPQEARWLIGFWCNKGASAPRKRLSAWAKDERYARQFWGQRIRDRVAFACSRVSHWKIHHGSAVDAPNAHATWFIDPPYQDAGRHYRCGSTDIDFDELGRWCISRSGQVIVCEAAGARWLPFQPLREVKALRRKKSAEVWWTNETTCEGWSEEMRDESAEDCINGVE